MAGKTAGERRWLRRRVSFWMAVSTETSSGRVERKRKSDSALNSLCSRLNPPRAAIPRRKHALLCHMIVRHRIALMRMAIQARSCASTRASSLIRKPWFAAKTPQGGTGLPHSRTLARLRRPKFPREAANSWRADTVSLRTILISRWAESIFALVTELHSVTRPSSKLGFATVAGTQALQSVLDRTEREGYWSELMYRAKN